MQLLYNKKQGRELTRAPFKSTPHRLSVAQLNTDSIKSLWWLSISPGSVEKNPLPGFTSIDSSVRQTQTWLMGFPYRWSIHFTVFTSWINLTLTSRARLLRRAGRLPAVTRALSRVRLVCASHSNVDLAYV